MTLDANYARATLAKRPFVVVNRTSVKFDRNLPNLGKIYQNCGQIHACTSICLSHLVKFCQIVAKCNINSVNFDQIRQS